MTRLILIPHSLNKIESEELVVDDVEKSFDNNEVSYENLGETIAVTNLGELFNIENIAYRIEHIFKTYSRTAEETCTHLVWG